MIDGKQIAMVLGGTAPHCEVIEKLKNKGFYVILVDYLKDPPAKAHADLHIQESTLDRKAVLRIADHYDANVVLSCCVDQANATACYVQEKRGLYTPYSYEVALNVTNKTRMKEIMIGNCIKTPTVLNYKRNEPFGLRQNMFPVYIKPSDSCSSKGVKRANNKQEFDKFIDEALSISTDGRVIIEEEILGTEVSAYFVVVGNIPYLLNVVERICIEDGVEKNRKCIATITCNNINADIRESLNISAKKIIDAFEIDNTPLLIQGVFRNGEFYVLEFAPRVAGGIAFEVIKDRTEYDILDAAIQSWMGERISIPKIEIKESTTIHIVSTIYALSGVFDHIEGIEELMKKKMIMSYYPYKTQGTYLDDDSSNGGRVGAMIIKLKEGTEISSSLREIYNLIKVVNSSGKDIIRRDIVKFVKQTIG